MDEIKKRALEGFKKMSEYTSILVTENEAKMIMQLRLGRNRNKLLNAFRAFGIDKEPIHFYTNWNQSVHTAIIIRNFEYNDFIIGLA